MNDIEIESFKNLRYGKRLSLANLNFRRIKKNQEIETDELIQKEVDKKINQITKKDIQFYRKTSKKMLFEMIHEAHKKESQMFDQLKQLIEEHKNEEICEKENAEILIYSTNKGRKRKLNQPN